MLNKIGIITFHRAVNYGAVLQSYALQKYISNLDYNCEVIDYTCEKFKNVYNVFNIYNHNIKGVISTLIKAPYISIKNRKFERFINNHINLSSNKYNSNNIALSNNEYDVFITGSDQVWNLELTDLDKTYLLDFVINDKIRLSYAASMGKVDTNIDRTNIFKQELSQFKHINVRENDAKEYLSKILNRENIDVVLDPVFLIEKNEWEMIASKPKQEGYILVYLLHEESVYEIAEKLSKLTNLKVICIQNNLKKKINANYVFTLGPEEFVGYFANASYIVTDSFHGVAFGTIFRKNLKVILKKNLEHLNSRILTLLKSMDIEAVVDETTTDKELVCNTIYDDACIDKNIEVSRKILTDMLKEGCQQ